MRAARLVALGSIVTTLLACSSQETKAPEPTDASGGSMQDALTEDSAKPEGGGGEAGCDPQTQMTSTQCNDCLAVNELDAGACAALRDACKADAECTAIIACWQDEKAPCHDELCVSTCIQKHPQGVSILLPLLACIDTRCHDECYCSGCRFGVSLCNPCLEKHCEQACHGCDRDPQCMAFVYCMSYTCAADDLACQTACGDKFDGGVDPYVGMATCGQEQCTTECGFEVDAGADAATD